MAVVREMSRRAAAGGGLHKVSETGGRQVTDDPEAPPGEREQHRAHLLLHPADKKVLSM